jgi:hypothetical protein
MLVLLFTVGVACLLWAIVLQVSGWHQEDRND